MNAYITDRAARDHVDRMMADALVWRSAKRARLARRAATASRKTAARARPSSKARAALSHVLTRPYAALSAWLSAGLL
jgi:hypothetical protein